MQLTVRNVTELLGVGESTVYQWINQQELPAHRVQGHYRFNRAELLEWAIAHHVKVAGDLFEGQDPQHALTPSLAATLRTGGVVHHLQARDKNDALRVVVENMRLPPGMDAQFLLGLLVARESLASTGVGDGIAIPHVRNPIVLDVPRPQITLCFLDSPVPFGALDGKPVHVVFSLISTTVRVHLHLLSRLSFALHDARFKEAVTRHAAADEIYQEAQRIEDTLAADGATRKEKEGEGRRDVG
jgi:PTS system nitrogen regulatory IIA component